MRKVIPIIIALCITSVAFSQPKFEFVGDPVKDWGKVMQNEGPLKTTIKIKNTGDKLLEIFAVKPGCGCTTAPIDKKLLDPGDIATVKVDLKIEKDNGPITKGIEFTTNDPKNDRIDFLLKANVKIPIELFPKFMNMGTVDLNTEMTARIVLSNHTNKDITVTNVSITDQNLKTNIKKGFVFKAGTHNSVEGILKTGTEGVYDTKIVLTTNSKKHPLIEIPVRGMVGTTK
ncbi:MAG: hypothetical protein CVV25_04370 [Ignavibacteriae bacterium HGW-Ignavibacteriae-4]|jgi:hypothetical protein|nr:MAG: hypothetical protein CVV25_04370 [Ignavibacteriae bacterium HGW-Ignavibacteriae-4]